MLREDSYKLSELNILTFEGLAYLRWSICWSIPTLNFLQQLFNFSEAHELRRKSTSWQEPQHRLSARLFQQRELYKRMKLHDQEGNWRTEFRWCWLRWWHRKFRLKVLRAYSHSADTRDPKLLISLSIYSSSIITINTTKTVVIEHYNVVLSEL